MKNKTAIRGVLTVIGIIVLFMLVCPAIRPPRARAQRISAVNNVSVVFSAPMTNASTLPTIHP
jgi:hypothetical protein